MKLIVGHQLLSSKFVINVWNKDSWLFILWYQSWDLEVKQHQNSINLGQGKVSPSSNGIYHDSSDGIDTGHVKFSRKYICIFYLFPESILKPLKKVNVGYQVNPLQTS